MKNKNIKIISLMLLSSFLIACGGKGGSSSSTSEYSSSTTEESSELSSESSLESSSESSSEEIIDEFATDTAPFYIPVYSSGDYQKKEVSQFDYGYYKDNKFFIYMPIDTAFSFLFPESYTEEISIHHYRYETTDGLIVSIDAENDTLTFVNFDEVNLFSKESDSRLGVIDESHTKEYVRDGGSTYEGGINVTFDLSEYELEVVERNSRAYIPFSILNNIFFTNKYYSAVCFNGTAFYLLDMLNGVIGLNGGTSTSFTNDYYHGAFRGLDRNEKALKDNFNAFMWQLDHIYGFLDERMVPFKSYLSENYPEIIDGLLSKANYSYTSAVNRILDEVIGDGHTNSGMASNVFSTGSTNTPSYSSEREQQLNNAYYECAYARYNTFGYNVPYIRYSGNTAIVTFDGFYHEARSFKPSNINNYRDNDGFALFHYVFDQLKSKSAVTNVIFDVSCNGGGDTNALIPMLGFLTNKVELTMYNPLSKLAGHLTYEVDTNLDGNYDENDNYADKYNFFVLTSNYSFSCANLFTMICKNSGLATIIGQQSGGGACVVTYTATPDGKPFRISGLMRNGFKDDIASHDDFGIPVDIEIDDVANFYNDTYLNNLVNNL